MNNPEVFKSFAAPLKLSKPVKSIDQVVYRDSAGVAQFAKAKLSADKQTVEPLDKWPDDLHSEPFIRVWWN